MIAKHVSMKTVQKSDFAGLVKYITDEQGKTERPIRKPSLPARWPIH